MRGLVVAAICAGLLAGCSAVPPLDPPTPLSQDDAEQRVRDAQERWWLLTAPKGEPIPTASPIEYVDPGEGDKSLACFTDQTGVPSTTYDARYGHWTGPDGSFLTDDQNRSLFICTLQYPDDLSHPAALGMYSDEERAWAWTYQRTRLVPCLQLMGYSVENREDGYIPSTPWWNPYDEVKPTPSSAGWDFIDEHCPPSPYGPTRP